MARQKHFRLTDLSGSIELGQGSCTYESESGIRKTCQMTFVGEHKNLGNLTKVEMTFRIAQANINKSYFRVSSFKTTVTDPADQRVEAW